MKPLVVGRLNFTKVLVAATTIFVLVACALLIRYARQTDIHGAIRSGDTARIEAMLARRPDLTQVRKEYGYTPLLVAAEAGCEDIVELLLTKGSSLSETDYFGNTALHLASTGGHSRVVSILLAKGAKVAAKNRQGDLPLHLAADGNHRQVARLLIEARTDINAGDSLGRTPLRRALDRGRKEIADLLREHGAKE